MIKPSGESYEGDFVRENDQDWGSHATNGDRYEGQWLSDEKNGPGRFFYNSTKKIYEGEWIDGVAKADNFAVQMKKMVRKASSSLQLASHRPYGCRRSGGSRSIPCTPRALPRTRKAERSAF